MLKLHRLTQRYGARVALDALSLQVARGSFVVLLGPNGAGKSTLFQVLTGLFAADAGYVEVAGWSMRSDARRALAQIERDPSLQCDEVQYVVNFIRTSSRGVGLRRPSRRLEEVADE